MTFCQECANPWGVLLDRGEEPSPEGIELARAELIERLWEKWECDYEPDELVRVDVSKLPKVVPSWVVYVTESLARSTYSRCTAAGR